MRRRPEGVLLTADEAARTLRPLEAPDEAGLDRSLSATPVLPHLAIGVAEPFAVLT